MTWYGRDWQDYCLALLDQGERMRGTHDLQRVPDRDKGDLGLEAFSYRGYLYQCYAAEGEIATKELREKQQAKLHGDLLKLSRNEASIKKMLGDLLIQRYVFMVPEHRSRQLIDYAQGKVSEVKSWNLPFISDEFQILIETEKCYPAEMSALGMIPTQMLVAPQLSESEALSWNEKNQGLIGIAISKLTKLGKGSSAAEAVFQSAIIDYLEGAGILDKLRDISPDTYDLFVKAKDRKERRLITLAFQGRTLGLVEIVEQFSDELERDFQIIGPDNCRTLAWATVADWLMRCPLDWEQAS